MDSRDIKEEPKQIQGNKFLEEIYSMQKGLLSGYIGIEGLPQYPVDINTRASQTLLKDFTARVIEELSEGYESFQLIDSIMQKNLAQIYAGESPSLYTELLNHLQNANEENADAIHFFIELLIYVNIQPQDIRDYIDKWVLENKAQIDLFKCRGDILDTAIALGAYWLFLGDEVEFNGPQNTLSILKPYMESDSETFPMFNEKLLQGGKDYNHNDYVAIYPYLLWKITHHLNIARNFLKNKPWKQSQVMTQELKYQAELVKAFIYFCGYLGYLGMNSEQVFYIYFKKNHINRFRQKSKY